MDLGESPLGVSLVMRVLLLRSNNLRHQALSSILQMKGYLAAEIVEPKSPSINQSSSLSITQHFQGREQSEKDFFGLYSQFSNLAPRTFVSSGELNSNRVLDFIDNTEFNLAITFGVSILKPILINKLRDSVMGIHLGLSPYYRGSGTNFFPFVNAELAAIGYTLMHLNHEIDRGPIIHQGRAPIILGDSIHTIGNRNISAMFNDIVNLLKINVDVSLAISPSSSDGRLYKRKDFSEDTLMQAHQNLESGLIRKYLLNYNELVHDYPIIQYEYLGSDLQ
jgi:phosphoribosylglycinamide formyltransferase 1